MVAIGVGRGFSENFLEFFVGNFFYCRYARGEHNSRKNFFFLCTQEGNSHPIPLPAFGGVGSTPSALKGGVLVGTLSI